MLRTVALVIGVALVALLGFVPSGGVLPAAPSAFASQADCDTLDVAVIYDGINDECDLNVSLVKNGTFSVGRTLHIGPTGKITTSAAPGLTLNIAGSLIIDTPSGATGTNGINGDVNNAPSLPITIIASGDVTLHGNGSRGARITSSRTGIGEVGDGGGDITILAGARNVDGKCLTPTEANPPTGVILMENGSQVLANSAKYGAGNIVMNACKRMDIDGLVESKSAQTGTGAVQSPGGGPITLDAGCDLEISDTGKVSSEGIDPGSDLVHLGAGCSVLIYGLVQSIGAGHVVPNSPHNHCDNTNHQDKSLDATGCVEVWAGDNLIIDSLNHNGQVNADKVGSCSNHKLSWIDLFARGNINLVGAGTGPFVVHADSCAASDQTGGIIQVKSQLGSLTATARAISASGSTSNGGDGGSIVTHANKDVTLDTASLIASGHFTAALGIGGSIDVQSFAGKVSWLNGNGDVRPNATGTISITACGSIALTPSAFNGETPTQSNGCASGPSFSSYVVLPACTCGIVNHFGCPTCDGSTVLVDTDVKVDFNPVLKGGVPTCDDGAVHDLCLFFSYDISGPTPDTWKAIFDVGPKKIIIKDNAIVTTSTVPLTGTNRRAPGIVIISSCELEIEGDNDNNGKPGGVVVVSVNMQAGDILLKIDGNITINGEVRNEVTGTLGRPGEITIASCCGDIVTGPRSKIQTIGVDPGGNDINILTCCERGYDETGGDIVINGLVRAVHKTGITPTINIVAFVGAVTIDGRNDLGDVPGTGLRRTSGVLVETLNATDGGDIYLQALTNVTVLGNRILFTNKTNYGAVAIKTNNTNGQGGNGQMLVVARGGSITASDRAFDFANRFNHASNTFITLLAGGDVSLSVTAAINAGAADNTKAVVSSQGGSGGQGGTDTLRAYGPTGNVIVGANAQVLANAPGGSNGVNNLISCAGVLGSGTVNPADANPGDDSGTCSTTTPTPLYIDCEEFGVVFEHDGQES